MSSVQIVHSERDAELAHQLASSVRRRGWEVELALPSAEPMSDLARTTIVLIPAAADDAATVTGWTGGTVVAGGRPIVIAPSASSLDPMVGTALSGVIARDEFGYDELVEQLFRLLVGPLPDGVDVLVRPTLVSDPIGVAWCDGDLIVADAVHQHLVRVSARDSRVLLPGLRDPRQVHADGRRIWASDDHDVLSCDIVDGMAANVEAARELAGLTLRGPRAAASGAQGRVVADTGNDRVLFSLDGVVWRPLDPRAPFSQPGDVCLDDSGFWVADTGNERVVGFDADGVERVVIDEGAGSPIAVARWGDLLIVADEANEAVHAFPVDATSGSVAPPHRLGAPWIARPSGVAVDDDGRLAVADRFRACVWLIDVPRAIRA